MKKILLAVASTLAILFSFTAPAFASVNNKSQSDDLAWNFDTTQTTSSQNSGSAILKYDYDGHQHLTKGRDFKGSINFALNYPKSSTYVYVYFTLNTVHGINDCMRAQTAGYIENHTFSVRGSYESGYNYYQDGAPIAMCQFMR